VNGFQENCVQRANAAGVLRAVPIRGLFHTAWAKSGLMQCSKRILFDHLVRHASSVGGISNAE
jgi:hypothetical protein